MAKLVECVPNFSEGRDMAKIEEIKKAILTVENVDLLDVDPGNATNRTVFTFVGEPEPVLEAAFRAIKRASELIDMRTHSGAHPRMGATDVCPFIPIAGMSIEETVELTKKLGKRVGEELNIPVFLYEYSAAEEKRISLASIREGEYEIMGEKLQKSEWRPDFGPAKLNEKAGVTAIGVREFLIAYNLNLNTKSVKIANKIAKEIREKGKKVKQADGSKKQVPGLLKEVRAVGWFIDEYGIAQISVNLINYKITPLWKLFETASNVADKYGVRITGSELVGLMPLQTLKEAGLHFLEKAGTSRAVSEEEILKIGVKSLGLAELYPFQLKEKIIEYAISKTGVLTSKDLISFNEELASDSPAPGGGSVAALVGVLSASLIAMVANLTFGKKKYKENWDNVEKIGMKAQKIKDELIKFVDSDTEIFSRFMDARKLPKATSEEKELRIKKLEELSLEITLSPLNLLKKLKEIPELLEDIEKMGNQNSISDVGVAASCLKTAVEGAYLNIIINLPSLEDNENKQNILKESEELYEKLVKSGNEIFNKVKEHLKG
ncbi:glutamate formimidoyltransferase [bacterium]|nr:glutamate formimidoyltransferase [bacterium]